VWTGASIGIQGVVGLAAQVVLARFLTARDFGIFALVVAFSFLLGSLGNFGVRTMMSQRTAEQIDAELIAVYRMGLVAAVLSGIALAALGPVAAALMGESELGLLLPLSATTFVLRPYVAVGLPILQSRLRFREAALVLTGSTTMHYATAIALATAGFGAVSLVVGTQMLVLAQSGLLWWATGTGPIAAARGPSSERLRDVARRARWPLLGEVATDASGRIDYLVLGFFVPTAVLGRYYFAFQLVARLHLLLVGVARNVLFPALSQLPDSRARQFAGVRRAGVLLVFAGSAAAAALIASIRSIEQLFWGGEWALAVGAMMYLASVAPLQAFGSVVEQLLKARGRFKRWTAVLFVRAVGIALVALAVGIVLGPDATASAIGLAVAAFLGVSALTETWIMARWLDFRITGLLRTVIPVWVVLVGWGWAVAAATSGLDLTAIASVLIEGLLVAMTAAIVGWIVIRAGIDA
jgi:PST family polysaccharide transporter